MIEYIVQLLRSVQFTDQEISSLFITIYNSVEQNKDIEYQISNSLNYKLINGFNLVNETFGGDWYNLVKSNVFSSSIGLVDSNGYLLIDSADYAIKDSLQ